MENKEVTQLSGRSYTNKGPRNDEMMEVGDQNSQVITIKKLAVGHGVLQANLQKAMKELSEKQSYLRDRTLVNIEDESSCQREKNWLMEERKRSMIERLCCISRALERREKQQESLFTEVAEVNWRLQETKHFMEKLKRDRENFESKSLLRKQELKKLDGWQSQMTPQRDQIREEIKMFQSYKLGLENGDVQLCAVRNGSKIKELEERKQAIRRALSEREAKCETMLVEIDEKTKKLEQLKLSMEIAEKQYPAMIKQLNNRLQCQIETERRMKISNDYLQSKVDYGASTRSHIPPMVSRQVVLPLKRI